jgi:hypothetical protein
VKKKKFVWAGVKKKKKWDFGVWEDRAGMAWLVRHWDGGQSTRLVTLVPNMQKLWCGCQYLASYRCFVDFYM